VIVPFGSLFLLSIIFRRTGGTCDICGAKLEPSETRCEDCADHMRGAPKLAA